jgi:GTP-binding protein
MALIPKVVIVGRMNVGKSTLFNRLSVDVKSIAFDYAGVTRDIITDEVTWGGKTFELIDTGGISLRKTDDEILEKVRLKALEMVHNSDVVLFVVDATTGVLPEDRELSKMLHKTGKPVIVIANKAEGKAGKEHQYEFERLGYKNLFFVSAQHGLGIGDILDTLVQVLPEKKIIKEEFEPTCRVVLLGKPNVGKSSLMNLLLKKERSIVADVPGTTREAISERITFYQEDMLITDTPGVRRKRSIDEPLESLMVKSTLHAVKDTDIVLLLIDASQGTIADQELKLAFYAFNEQYKSVILLYNKTDLVEGYAQEQLSRDMQFYEHFLKKVVTLNISCKTGKNVGRILPLVKQVWQRYTMTIPKHELIRVLKEALLRTPLFHKTQRLDVHWARQLSSAPMTILLMVNEPQWFGESQLAFFENVLRKNYDLKGVPVRFVVRGGFDGKEE